MRYSSDATLFNARRCPSLSGVREAWLALPIAQHDCTASAQCAYCTAACNSLSPSHSVIAAWWARQLADVPHLPGLDPAAPQAAAQQQGAESGPGLLGAADGAWDAWTAGSARWAELRGAAACALQQCLMGALQLTGVSGCGKPSI